MIKTYYFQMVYAHLNDEVAYVKTDANGDKNEQKPIRGQIKSYVT